MKLKDIKIGDYILFFKNKYCGKVVDIFDSFEEYHKYHVIKLKSINISGYNNRFCYNELYDDNIDVELITQEEAITFWKNKISNKIKDLKEQLEITKDFLLNLERNIK